jgi:hypothetical protein
MVGAPVGVRFFLTLNIGYYIAHVKGYFAQKAIINCPNARSRIY